MASKIQAAEQIRALAKLYEAMVEAADVLESIGKLEKAKSAMEEAKLKAEKEIAVRSALISESIRKSEEEAASILSRADSDADKSVSIAKSRADALLASATEKLSNLNAEIGSKQSQLTGIQGAVAEKQAELELIENKLNKAKDGLRKLIEG
jgi:hypothetical protein